MNIAMLLSAMLARLTGATVMSFFKNVGQWFISSGIENAAKQAAVEALTKSAQHFVSQIEQHSPDFAEHLSGKVADTLSSAVAAALTRKH